MTDNNENEVNEITEETSEAIHTDDAEMDDSVPVEENLQEKIDEQWDKILRLQAEIENLRKRNVKDIESAAKASIERVHANSLQRIVQNSEAQPNSRHTVISKT